MLKAHISTMRMKQRQQTRGGLRFSVSAHPQCYPFPRKHLPPKPPPNSATTWGPNIQMPKTIGAFLLQTTAAIHSHLVITFYYYFTTQQMKTPPDSLCLILYPPWTCEINFLRKLLDHGARISEYYGQESFYHYNYQMSQQNFSSVQRCSLSPRSYHTWLMCQSCTNKIHRF